MSEAPGAAAARHRATSSDWVDWILAAGFVPHSKLTLTFENDVCEGKAWAMWHRLVRELNVRTTLGPGYRRKVKHSYFGYVVGMERQARGVVHLHAVVDNRVSYVNVHRLWNEWAGWAWCKPVRDGEASLRYALKYALKSGGQPLVWLQRERRSVSEPLSGRVCVNPAGQELRASPYLRGLKGDMALPPLTARLARCSQGGAGSVIPVLSRPEAPEVARAAGRP